MAFDNEKNSQKRKSNIRDHSKLSKKHKKQHSATANKDDNGGSASAAPAVEIPLLVQDEDPDFPRGGRSLLSREEVAEARAEAEAQFKRDVGKAKRKGKDKGQKRRGNGTSSVEGVNDLGSLIGEGITGRLPKFANRITVKNISQKMKLWGVVMEVNSKDLVIGLPGGLRGYVRAEEASDLSVKGSESTIPCNVFHVGQLVSCVVLQVDEDKQESKGNKRIWLSLRLSVLHRGLTLDAVQEGMVLTAQVKSVEDHGCILHFGPTSFTGFLPTSGKVHGQTRVGQFLQGVVRSIDKARAVAYLNSDADVVSKSVTKDLKGLSIEQLAPGMLVNARVHAVLDNGIMLAFLTYFTGTVDIFNLQHYFPSGNWKDDYAVNNKVSARILFIDPSSRAVGLTLNSDLVRSKAPTPHVKIGDIYDDSVIIRVDHRAGILLQVPSSPIPSPVYVNIHDVSDEETIKLEKKFKEGGHVRLRILGYKHLEGLAIGTLKPSAFEGSVFTHSDVRPGMLVKAKVIEVVSFGAYVQFSSGVKALCPLPHMSEFEIAKPTKEFKVGAQLLFRILGCKSKLITVTRKKTLVKSKLDALASYADATENLVVHGWISKIENHGCFVKFYNGVRGFVHRNAQDSVVREGSIVSGIIDQLTPTAVTVHLNSHGNLTGSIPNEHLADHQMQATLLKSLLKPGYEFDQLLVLDTEGKNVLLSAKYSLIKSANEIPSDVQQVNPSSVVHGYVCNLIETGCFIRFLGRLTGFSPKNKVQATDEKTSDLSDAFEVGQSVRSYVLSANSETGRIKLSLQQSSCFSIDASFIQGYFTVEDKIASLQIPDKKHESDNWLKKFSIGSVVEGEIQEVNEFGVVLNFKCHNDVVGFVTHHQLGGHEVKKGSVVKAFVLDITKSDNLVDLSIKSELVKTNETGIASTPSKKKRLRPECVDLNLQQTVKAVVEIVKENYLVLSLPDYGYTIGFASVTDYNTQKLPRKQFVPGQIVPAIVSAHASTETCGRLLLMLKSLSEVSRSPSSKRAKKESYTVGSLVEGEVIDIKPLEIILKIGKDLGRVHITEVFEDDHTAERPFSKFEIGEVVKARIIAKAHRSGKGGKGYQWELSIRPHLIAGTLEIPNISSGEDFNFSVGDHVTGYVVKVDPDWVWLTVSRYAIGRLYLLDSSTEPIELQEFQKHYHVGEPVNCFILSINREKKLLRLKTMTSSAVQEGNPDHAVKENAVPDSKADVKGYEHIVKGTLICGRIKKLLPGVGGILVQIGPHLHGKVHHTEIVDMWAADPQSHYQENQFVKCRVLDISRSLEGSIRVDLSLRASLCSFSDASSKGSYARLNKFDDLRPGMDVQGYVKNVNTKGCFIMLSRVIDARILLSNLSNGYIENPELEFPVGKLVHGKVLSVDPSSRRVDVTLKTDDEKLLSNSNDVSFSSLLVGDEISGNIKRIESYGLFIKIERSSMVGLCHISELSDEPIDDIESRYHVGDKVVCKILKIDGERQRISLGMKKAYFEVDNDDCQNTDKSLDSDADVDHALPNGNMVYRQDLYEQENSVSDVLSQADSRTYVPPLEVPLDDLENSDSLDLTVQSTLDNETGDKKSRRMRRKEKEEREVEISAAEMRNLQNDVPQTADDFEKLVRSSPNSSIVWTKYMAFMLSLADVGKAREIAERALRTINIQEEGEKLNIWVAYLNLESRFGSPPEEAVKKIFQRALQFCDPKKLHLALLGVYERTNQEKLADELLERMTKKFRGSCKVWLCFVRAHLSRNKDGIQSIINRATLSLAPKKHIKFFLQTAILEFQCGSPDRGRSLFEHILREHPKRTDIWSVYLDQEIRNKDTEVIRALFEKATCLSLPLKKMKFLLKKYLAFEESIGDEGRVEYVKQKALELADKMS